MGPHFFKCGKREEKGKRKEARLRFNGAALFQVRKEDDGVQAISDFVRLQWGRTFSSAERAFA